ncbi:MAG: glutamate--tRNA ligase [Bacteroidota bacterium]|nr:MAG: glutamate--tRNA ligase [Bacteroidota bacterium]
MSQRVRVRFAPSPTGPLHIGGVRTALFNYLFAKKSGGDFLLRIEDTDQARFVPGAEQYINEALEWLGMVPDEGVKQGGPYGPYKQSERKEIYLPLAQKLIDTGWAYYAFDTPEDLENLRLKAEADKQTFAYDYKVRNSLLNSLTLGEKLTAEKIKNGEAYIIRFKMPENYELTATDLIRGNIRFNTSTLDDKVIFKSDGLPTYHLANVADDYAMKITHVIRGEEWLPSLPLHVMLYKALGWEESMPSFAHLPLILKPSGKGKLSKRDGDKEGFPVFPLEWKSNEGEIARGYRESGYFPEAVINLLALLGWNPGSEQELFSMQELINAFSLERVNKSGARFDPEKAKWFNQQYLKTKTDAELATDFQSILSTKAIHASKEYVTRVVSHIKDRAVFVGDFWELSSYFFEAPITYEEKTVQKFWKEETPALLKDCLKILENLNPFTSVLAEAAIKNYIESNELGFGKIMNPLRLAIVGAGKGPHLFDIMEMIGKEESLRRIEKAIQTL